MSGILQARTYLFRSHSQLRDVITPLRDLYAGHSLLFSLSHNTPDLEHAISQLSSCSGETLGCLSSPLPVENPSHMFSCSIAVFEKERSVPFSTLESSDMTIQIGRARSYRKQEMEYEGNSKNPQLHNISSWDRLWDERHSISLPKELKNKRNIQSFVYFTGSDSWGLGSTLHHHFPTSCQLGILASSTPFVTGRPNTLFRNGKIQSSGAVGIALLDTPTHKELHYNGLVRLTGPLPVQRSEGNLIHELGDSLPARILLASIKEHGLSDDLAKEVDYFINIKPKNSASSSPEQLLRIVAGSPSQGSIAVEEVSAPEAGTDIEFYYRPQLSKITLPNDIVTLCNKNSDCLLGSVVYDVDSFHRDSSLQSQENKDETRGYQVYNHSFLNASEHGFILSPNVQNKLLAPWRCSVSGAFGGLRFNGL
ncbi:hypothetical protein PNOK_0729900 [Pyrrhoderma noxium]|uniref:FIST domain-containing protein n=1 Tax=Pyrrhoderma noxium TaxID=2282107 RepID=A0A286UCI5_9AGAM|nr:hypothetical protein PNOK_0729900 [Pyrrhoderma noxium]